MSVDACPNCRAILRGDDHICAASDAIQPPAACTHEWESTSPSGQFQFMRNSQMWTDERAHVRCVKCKGRTFLTRAQLGFATLDVQIDRVERENALLHAEQTTPASRRDTFEPVCRWYHMAPDGRYAQIESERALKNPATNSRGCRRG